MIMGSSKEEQPAIRKLSVNDKARHCHVRDGTASTDAAQVLGTVCLRSDGCHRAPIAGVRLAGSENWAAQLIMLNRP